MKRSTIVVVEHWSNYYIVKGPDGDSRDTGIAHIADNMRDAFDWCEENKNYASFEDDWHWRLCETTIGGDWAEQNVGAAKHFTRSLEECNFSGDVEVEEEEDDNDWGCSDSNDEWQSDDDFTSYTSVDKQDQIIALLKAINNKL